MCPCKVLNQVQSVVPIKDIPDVVFEMYYVNTENYSKRAKTLAKDHNEKQAIIKRRATLVLGLYSLTVFLKC